MSHLILVQVDQKNSRIKKVQYMESKFERELGEVIKYDGEIFNVGIIGDNKKDVILAINDVIKLQNKLDRKEAKKEDQKFWNQFKNDPKIKEYVNVINNNK